MKEKSAIIKIGEFVGDLFLLQFYFLVYSLKGFVLFGVFPSFLACVKVLTSKFYSDNPDTIEYEFGNAYKTYFKIANKIGWIIAICGWILIFDYNVNQNFLENSLIRIFLLILIVLLLILISHMPITIIRFALKQREYFKQAMLLALSSPTELISIIVSLLLIEQIFLRYPIIVILLAVPILAMPFAWFSYKSVEKIKKKGQSDGR